MLGNVYKIPIQLRTLRDERLYYKENHYEAAMIICAVDVPTE